VIEIKDLYKYYGDRRAVGPLSFTIETGEVVGLLGVNGAGKTTTLRVLACDLLPSSGTVKVDGLDVVAEPDAVRRRIGYLPDTPPLYPEMSVRGYLTFAARLRGTDRRETARRVEEAAHSTQLERVIDDPISSLSHGFRQRVGIAQAIVHKPRLLVLDEPISGLDPVQIVEMRELVKRLRGEHTIVVSSHILSEVGETCDRVLVIHEGQLSASGTSNELSERIRGTGPYRDGHMMSLEVTLRGSEADALTVARAVDGVKSVDASAATSEAGAITLHVEAKRDVRAELSAALIGADLALLELVRSKRERELESVFLRLAAGDAAKEGAS
jgi:ABC-2 type transport system ATP-binding protein